MNMTNRNTLRDGNAEASAEPRPESLPHGTTKDQIAEMESEGQAQQPGQDVAPETPAQDSRAPQRRHRAGRALAGARSARRKTPS